MEQYHGMNPEASAVVTGALLWQVQQQLGSAPTTAAADAQLLAAAGAGGAAAARLGVALHYRRERKLLLEAAERLLGCLPR
jgi:hypothetical protein